MFAKNQALELLCFRKTISQNPNSGSKLIKIKNYGSNLGQKRFVRQMFETVVEIEIHFWSRIENLQDLWEKEKCQKIPKM